MASHSGQSNPPGETPAGETQRLNAAIVSACPAAIYAKDTQGRYLLVNRQWEVLFHATRDQAKGKSDDDLFPPERVPFYRERESLMLETSAIIVFQESARIGNELRTYLGRLFPIRGYGGVVEAVCGILTDITEHKNARIEEELARKEEYYRALIENAMDMVTVLEPDGTVRSVTPAITRILGYEPEGRIGKNIEGIIHPDDLAAIKAAVAKALENRLDSATLEYRCRHKDGSWRVLESTARNLLQNPAIHGIVVNTRDVSERQRAEEALRQKEAALRDSQTQLHALTARLLTSQDEERSRIARELHDDLNQKLAFLAVEADMLEQRLSEPPDRIRERLRLLQGRAVALSDDVRRMAYQLHPAVLDDLGLEPALRSYCQEFSRLAGIPVEFSCRKVPESLPPEIALCLYRVSQELLHNLSKHSRAARGTVTLTGADGAIQLFIEDSGVGFVPEEVKGKRGLGIASMEERVRLVSGSILIESAPGKGTRITVRVPLPAQDR